MAAQAPSSDKRTWQDVAREVTQEQDSARLTKLCAELVESLDEQRAAKDTGKSHD